jgi:splicing factor 3B subunit 4
MLQAGPVGINPVISSDSIVNVHIPRDRISALHQGFGFVEFSTEDDADYALKVK